MKHRTGGLRLSTKQIAADYLAEIITPALDLEKLMEHPQIDTQEKAAKVYNELSRWLQVIQFQASR